MQYLLTTMYKTFRHNDGSFLTCQPLQWFVRRVYIVSFIQFYLHENALFIEVTNYTQKLTIGYEKVDWKCGCHVKGPDISHISFGNDNLEKYILCYTPNPNTLYNIVIVGHFFFVVRGNVDGGISVTQRVWSILQGWGPSAHGLKLRPLLVICRFYSRSIH